MEKEGTMKRVQKAVLRNSLVMLSLFALTVAGSGVAQAQECIARAEMPTTVRAEGITEVVGGIELRCRNKPTTEFGFEDADKLTLTVELNTQVTNEVNSATRVVSDLSHTTNSAENANFRGVDKEELSDEGTMITWKDVATDTGAFRLETGPDGITVVISGLRANASMVGHGGDITAVVRVNGEAVHSGALKLAGVKTGLEIKVTAASGVQCATTDTETAMITIKELLMNAIGANGDATTDADGLVVDFLNIPEGVTVTVPNAIMLPTVNGNGGVTQAMADMTFAVMLVTGRTAGVTTNEDDGSKSDVTLSSAGAGSARYTVTDVDDVLDGEWITLPVDFKWTAGNVIDMGEVGVSLYPVSTRGDAHFDDENVPTPRFIESDNAMTVISVTPCKTTLLFPFVTNMAGFDTGIAISNTSATAGSCTITFSGSDAPEPLKSSTIAAERHMTLLISATAANFQGYLTADCEFQKGYGFAFITDGFGGTPTLAQSYLAADITEE